MNERIEKLLKQCEIENYDWYGNLIEVGFDAEKFAELIIGECAGIIEAIDNGNRIEGTDNPIKAIRKRFGV